MESLIYICYNKDNKMKRKGEKSVSKVMYASNRFYKHNFVREMNAAIKHSLLSYNTGVRTAYAWQTYESRYNIKKYEESLFKEMKHKMYENNYYANSAVQEANGLTKSQRELNTLYQKLVEEDIKSIKKKLKTERGKLTKLRKMKESIIKGKPKFQKQMGYKKEGSLYTLQRKYISHIWFCLYDFEHIHIDQEIKRLQGKIGRIEHRLFRKEQKLQKLKTKINSVVFGSKKLFKSQYTKEPYIKNHKSWKQKFQNKRNTSMMISGRKDARTGNFVFDYEPSTKTLHMKDVRGRVHVFQNVVFPYGQEHVDQAITEQINKKDKKQYGKPTGWSLEDHGDYYIFKIILDEPKQEYVNHYKGNGVIGIDLNVNHIAWSDLNQYGQLLTSGTHYFNLEGKTSNQITKIIENEAICIVDVAIRTNKPIAMETLDTTKSKSGGRYRNKKQNRMMSLFAYRKLIDAIKRRARKMGIEVICKSPAFTSQIGKMKYMKQKHISIHAASSYVIGRRGMGFKEKVPKHLLPYRKREKNEHHWKEWIQLHKRFKDLRPFLWYHTCQGSKLFSDEILNYELLEKEKKVLQKIVSFS